ncbi:extracellular solute-binding protein [Aureibacillus halotolerans]|uniref:Carbohydrate ABC transporter substrate-binding protein (CUT1 family) n=1 Tax=Aureibacillus halotolerans TaxID=1508390 RepID=A0A4R6TTC1_9BACI|nr:extracellular solute-binding protein [Aureibacillus halotolerans]TDQ33717.1 carbohydrate ABC transporter substrate-binding protein (CUT1 family) [Aureibacillus halotolerans]
MKTTFKGAALAGMCLLFIVSGCSGGTNESASNESPSDKTSPSEPADPFGAYEEPITIRIGQVVDPTDTSLPEGDTPLDNQYTRSVKENLNIDVEHYFTAAPANYDQKVSLAIASNDLPDAMVVGAVEVRQMYESGQLEDLTEVYENYASPTIKQIIDGTGEIALGSATFDGKLMAIPNIQVQADGVHTLWIRQDWLDKLGLEPPQTVAALEEVARAFVEDDPDGNGQADTIGLSGPDTNGHLYATFLRSTNNSFGLDGIFSAYEAYPGYWLEDDNGDTVYGSILPETKEALAKLRDMYANGLIDKEMAVRSDASELVAGGKSGMFFGPWWMGYGAVADAIKDNPDANWQAYALPLNENGEYTPHLGTPTGTYLVVRKGYEHPEAAMKIVNNYLKEEPTFDESKGGLGMYPLRIIYSPLDTIEYSLKAIREVLAGNKTPEDYAGDEKYPLLVSDLETVKIVKKEPYDDMDIEHWDPEADMGIWSRIYSIMVGGAPLADTEYTGVYSQIYSQTSLMQQRWVNLQKMEDETFLKIIMGTEPLDTFDTFVEDWKSQGGTQITEEVAELATQ